MPKQLKVGDRLYRICYYVVPFSLSYERKVEQFTITKVLKNHVETFGRNYKIPKSSIGTEYHRSKKDMYKYQLKYQKEAYTELMKDSVRPMEKEIKYLEKKVKEFNRG